MTIFKVQEHLLQASYIREYPRALVDEHDDHLRLAVKQYIPLDNPTPHDGDITIIGAHANGFPKEMYEPLWDELYHRFKDTGHRIRNIFMMDVAFQGRSGVLNASKLGNDPSWMDTSRDLFLLVNHFRNDIKAPIVGFGHSMGGVNVVNLAHIHPRLFTSMILVDPVIMRKPTGPNSFIPAALSTVRRDKWPNRAAAEASFRKGKFYQAWDPRVLDLWFSYGLRDIPKEAIIGNNTTPDTSLNGLTDDPEVVLTTTKDQEVMTFLRPGIAADGNPAPYPTHLPVHITHPDLRAECGPEGPFYRPELHIAFQNLATLRPSTMFIFAGQSHLSAEPLNADKLATTGTGAGGSGGVKAGRVKGVMMPQAGHLVPFEDISGVATHCISWLVPELARWKDETAKQQQEWDRVPLDEKAKLNKNVAAALLKYIPQRPKPSKL